MPDVAINRNGIPVIKRTPGEWASDTVAFISKPTHKYAPLVDSANEFLEIVFSQDDGIYNNGQFRSLTEQDSGYMWQHYPQECVDASDEELGRISHLKDPIYILGFAYAHAALTKAELDNPGDYDLFRLHYGIFTSIIIDYELFPQAFSTEFCIGLDKLLNTYNDEIPQSVISEAAISIISIMEILKAKDVYGFQALADKVNIVLGKYSANHPNVIVEKSK